MKKEDFFGDSLSLDDDAMGVREKDERQKEKGERN
jgi:hypothetical protein